MEPNEEVKFEKDELTGSTLLSGHEYDGIKELDNRLPRWWLWLFYITIAFAAVYFVRYHLLHTAALQDQEYQDEVSAYTQLYKDAGTAGQVDAATLAPLTDATSLEAGSAIFVKNCVVCHLSKGEGLVGPNLTDDYWIHGCKFSDIYTLIVNGVPEKGMISWKTQLSPQQIQEVTSYIITLHGTNPANPKAPQGELCQM
jgi:cytochrome c oxidase cbb3-type subunit 3